MCLQVAIIKVVLLVILIVGSIIVLITLFNTVKAKTQGVKKLLFYSLDEDTKLHESISNY